MKRKFIKFAASMTMLMAIACTDLEQEVLDGEILEKAATEYGINDQDATTLLNSAYRNMIWRYPNIAQLMAFNEISTHSMLVPTRGPDWDDGGIWRSFHTLNFDLSHPWFRNYYTGIYGAINAANLVLGSATASPDQIAEARFLRAMNYYQVIDAFGQAAIREIGSDAAADAEVLSRTEATQWVISELESVINELPQGGNGTDPSLATQNAAHFYLAKLYLNHHIFTGYPEDPAFDPSNPTVDPAMMDKVIQHVDAIQGVSIAANYWDNFIPENAETSTELIFTLKHVRGTGSQVEHWYRDPVNQSQGGWNAMSTTEDFFKVFDDPKEERAYKEVEEYKDVNWINLGYLQGEQFSQPYDVPFDQLDQDVQDAIAGRIWFADPQNRTGWVQNAEGRFLLQDGLNNKLDYTLDVQLLTSGNTLRTAGYRGVKYAPDNANYNNPETDFVMARYADAILMKAEALARKGDLGGANTEVKKLPHEANTTLSSIDDILDVRGRELWWECKRRNDLIRFGKFLEPRQLKDYPTDKRALLFPIPLAGLTNPNITQNPGY